MWCTYASIQSVVEVGHASTFKDLKEYWGKRGGGLFQNYILTNFYPGPLICLEVVRLQHTKLSIAIGLCVSRLHVLGWGDGITLRRQNISNNKTLPNSVDIPRPGIVSGTALTKWRLRM